MPAVVIIGAGMAGVTAAQYLQSNSFNDFKILEARNTVGGRIATKHYGNHYLELGAQWIHGEENNSVYSLAKRNNLICEKCCNKEWEIADKDYFFTQNGKRVSSDLIEVTCLELDRIFEGANKFYELETKHSIESVEAYTSIEFEKYLLKSEQHDDIKDIQRGLFKWRLLLEKCDNGCQTLKDMPLNMWGCYKECPGNYFTPLKYGFSKVIDVLLDKIPKEKILLNTAVKHIYWDELVETSCDTSGSEIDVSNGSNQYSSDISTKCGFPNIGSSETHKNRRLPIRIETDTGVMYEADHVIVTCSLGFLKENVSTLFKPGLPLFKISAISKLGFGVVNKIYLEFPEQFWQKDCTAIHLTWVNDEVPQNCDQDEPFQNLGNNWWRSLYGFDTVQFHPKLLCAWIAGEEAKYMETLADEEIIHTCHSIIERFTGQDVPKPLQVIRTAWASDPFICGSYSFSKMGTNEKDIEKLSTPLPSIQDPRLLFAGEATHIAYFSTTHGALESGKREAQRIVKLYQKTHI